MVTALIIEDSSFQRKVLKRVLKPLGLETTDADNLNKVVQIMGMETIGLVTLDLHLPAEHGIDILKWIKKKYPEVPVIVVSADIQTATRENLLKEGAYGFVTKPVDSNELTSLVMKILEGQIPGVQDLGEDVLDALKEVVNIGVGKAASSLNEMLSSHIEISVPKIEVIHSSEIQLVLNVENESTYSCVRLNFFGEYSGASNLMFFPDSVKIIYNLLTEEDTDDVSESSQQEVLMEVGNILLNSVMGTMGNITQVNMNFSPPLYLEGSIEHIFQDITERSSDILVAWTKLSVREFDIEGWITISFDDMAISSLIAALNSQFTS